MILYASTVWAQCITSLYLHSFPIGWILLLAPVYISGTKILNSWLGEGMVPDAAAAGSALLPTFCVGSRKDAVTSFH